jgi:hypothetical protein
VSGTFVPAPEWLALEWHHACITAGTVTLQRCAGCGRWRFPPRRYCAECASPDATFEPVEGTGVVRSLAVSHRSMDPGWQTEVPFATLVVELDEGPRLLAATHAQPDTVSIGTRVACTIEPRSEDFVQVWAEPTTA